jgi:hypothetical protein
LWVSRADARHSRNIAARATVSAVIFDSAAPEADAQGVYLEPWPKNSAVRTRPGNRDLLPPIPCPPAQRMAHSRRDRTSTEPPVPCACVGVLHLKIGEA